MRQQSQDFEPAGPNQALLWISEKTLRPHPEHET
jgi:hypothetical protein